MTAGSGAATGMGKARRGGSGQGAGLNRIDKAFEKARSENRAAMIFFLTAGHPTAEATVEAVEALAEAGADVIELGIPFSDPIADGPTIQHASQVALEGGMTVRGVLDLVRRIRERSDVPLVLFSGYNPIFHFGEAKFGAGAAEAGADGVLVPDLPPEEATDLIEICRSRELKIVFLAAPTTTPERLREIAAHSTGFLYYISLRGITGARAALPEDLKEKVQAVKRTVELPVAVGFGISAPEHAREVAAVADGVVVGSALVRLIDEHGRGPELKSRVKEFARGLVEAVAQARQE